MNRTVRFCGLLTSSALGLVLVAQPSWAQAPEQGVGLEEVVVTATRQSDTVNRVPLSITAVTQKSLDDQGVKTIGDLQRAVPALTVTASTTGSIANIAIRGILATSGAPTTGVYLDDVPMQKRYSLSVNQSNGTPVPQLFDLERVEVLRGPQGTLFGGSSQGGTVRFITPAPSLTTYSGYGRVEVSNYHYGSESYEAGVAVGGPLVRDKLGFRVSAWSRRNGGWIDVRDPYVSGSPVRFKDANTTEQMALRGAVTWAVTDRFRATLSGYYSRDENRGWNNSTNLSTAAISTPERCFNGSPAPVSCATPGVFHRAAQTYGPYNLGPYDSLVWKPSPFTTKLALGSLTLDYDFSGASLKSISSYFSDHTSGTDGTSQLVTTFGGQGNLELFRGYPALFGEAPGDNRRYGLVQELRLTSPANATPLSWVMGAYASQIRTSTVFDGGVTDGNTLAGTDAFTMALFGITTAQLFPRTNGAIPGAVVGRDPSTGYIFHRQQHLTDTEYAAFGEVNYMVTDKLKLTAGVRASDVKFAFDTTFFGPFSGFLNPFANNNQGYISGVQRQKPVTPKFGAQYQFTENDMAYVTVAKGYRAGGTNSPISPVVCGPGLAQVGLTSADIPATYGPDSVWSYEAGAKIRVLNNRLQLNGSAYRIDWTGIQLQVNIPSCGTGFVQNVGSARSQGFDLQAQARLVGGLSLNFSVGYTDAKYLTDAFGPKPLVGVATPVVHKGDTLPVPPIQVALGLQYDFQLAGKYQSFIRGDYQYQSRYHRGLGPGVGSYSPDTRNAETVSVVNARAGVRFDNWTLELFAKNLLESRDSLSPIPTTGLAGGRSGCPVAQGAACTTPAAYNPLFYETYLPPRQVGVAASYRF